MKSNILVALVALLLGGTVFGLYKSLDLFKQNTNLEASYRKIETDLFQMRVVLEATKKALSESYGAKVQLEEEVNRLKAKVTQQEKETREHLRQIAQLTQKVQEYTSVMTYSMEEQDGLASQMMRLQLENVEMKKKLSSVTELKKAIKELGRKVKRSSPKKKKAAKKTLRQIVGTETVESPLRRSAPVQQVLREKEVVSVSLSEPEVLTEKAEAPEILKKEVLPEPQESQEIVLPSGEDLNSGFLVKDGRSTYQGIVEIKVTPTEAGSS